MQLSQDEVRRIWLLDKKREKGLFSISIVILIAVFLFSLCFRTATPGFIPGRACVNLAAEIRLFIAKILRQPIYLNRKTIISANPYYYETQFRLEKTLLTCVSGMGLALAGAIFQTVYRNPLASPNMLGATAGVNIGNILMVTIYSTAALVMPVKRYLYCYACTGIILMIVFLVGKIARYKKSNYSVIEMVMVGTIISQLFSIYVTYQMYNLMDDQLVAYQQLIMGVYLATDPTSMSIFFAAMCIGVIPMLLIRFRFNAVGIDVTEARAAGVNPVPLGIAGQICGVVLVTAAIVQCGDLGMLSLVVPHLARYFVGSDFRKVSVFSMIYGGIFLMICRIISSMIYIDGSELPVNFIISLLMMPIFLIVLVKQRRGFE